ncbi:Lysosomal amino acid transporter 1 [Dirofilaria immitis]|nr:Lysosomal amino acid transporter 1 [Dirofilaria immitis]
MTSPLPKNSSLSPTPPSRYDMTTSLLFRMIPKHNEYLYDKWVSRMSNNSEYYKMPNCTNGIGWVLDVFEDCIDTNLKLIGFVIGIVGDSCNAVGAVLADQQPLQKLLDMVILSQYFYYTRIYSHRLRVSARNNPITTPTAIIPGIFIGLLTGGTLLSSGYVSYKFDYQAYEMSPGKRKLLSIELLGGPPLFMAIMIWLLGYAIGSISATCYFAGRIPQLLKNYYRQSCEGLSLTMFYIIIAANATYGLSILLEANNWHYILRHLPWLAGSFGCCIFDVAVVIQYFYYDRLSHQKDVLEHEALLEDTD